MSELRRWTCGCGQQNAGPAPCSRCLAPAPAEVVAHPVVDAPARPSPWVRPLAVVIAVLLVAGAVSTLTVGDGDGSDSLPARTITVSPDQPPPSLPGVEGEVAAELPSLMRFVSSARGLPFKTPVEVTLLGDKAFRKKLLEGEEPDAEDRKRTATNQRVLVALGLLEKGVDLEDATESLLGAAVAGFYDTEENALFVRGERMSASVRVTLVHELTHALQDQHFELDRKDIDDRDDESSSSFTAVIEGDAVRVQEMYVDSLPEKEQKEAEEEEMEGGGGLDPSIPRILLELLGFPYIFGPPFTRAVVQSGGQERLDALFRDPPRTSEQIIHADEFVKDGEPPLTVADPSAEEEKVDAGVVGELGLLLVLQRLLEPAVAQRAARGWGGDRYVAWADGDKTCVRTNVVMDTPTDTAELRRALEDASKERKGFTVGAAGGTVTFTACA